MQAEVSPSAHSGLSVGGARGMHYSLYTVDPRLLRVLAAPSRAMMAHHRMPGATQPESRVDSLRVADVRSKWAAAALLGATLM